MDKIKVLIVDDDAILGATLTLGLDALGMQPIYQTSLAGLQSAIQSTSPNIILLDVEIGEDNGIDQMQQLKLYAPNIPVIFMSSHIDAGYLTRAIGEGAVNFLKKPFEIEELAAYILRFANIENKRDAASIVSIGTHSLNIKTRELSLNDKTEYRLTTKQFQVIVFLLEHQGETISRQELKHDLWPDGNDSDASLDNYISQLRKIFAADKDINIITVPKMGFKLELS